MSFNPYFFFTFLLGFVGSSFSQINSDTVLLISGKTILTNVIEITIGTDSTDGIIKYTHPKKSKKVIQKNSDNVFSITDSTGEKLVYAFDTSVWNDLTVEEMRYYIRGQQDARRYANKGFGALAINLIFSTGAGLTGNFFAPIMPFFVAGLTGLPRSQPKTKNLSDPEVLNYDTYLEGYEREGRRKRKIKSLLGGGIGMAFGLGTYFYLKKDGNQLIK